MSVPSIITQVSREDADSPINSPRRNTTVNGGGERKKKKKGFFARLFCCAQSVESDDNQGGNTPPPRPNTGANNGGVTALLGPPRREDIGKKCLILDLDETLVHSSFKPVPNPDFVIPVEIEDQVYQVYVLKRPGVDEFMRRVGEMYEVVVFTASLAKYADPVLDLLDKHKVIRFRLFREACCNHKGNYVKDLGIIGRPLKDTIIIDNSPASYLFNPENAVPIESWFDDPNDNDLIELLPYLEQLTRVDDVMTVLDQR